MKATNREVRISNRRRVINILSRQGPMTVQELISQTALSHGTIVNIVKELTDWGLVERGDKLVSSGGRPPSYLTVVSNARCAIGISLASNHIRIIQVNLSAEIVNKEKHTLKAGSDIAYLENVSRLLEEFIQRNGIDEDSIVGIGLSLQSPVQTGKSVFHYPSFGEFAMWDVKTISEIFKRSINISNDAKAAAFAQIWNGNYDDDLVFLFLGAGVGGAIIVERSIWDKGGKNAEFGHMSICENGKVCSCGQRGCLGRYCSSRSIRKQADVGLDVFFENLPNNSSYKKIWDEYLHYLAIGVNNIHTIFDTQLVIGGEMSPYLTDYEEQLKEKLDCLNPFGEASDYLKIGEYGENDSAVGAALMHISAFLND